MNGMGLVKDRNYEFINLSFHNAWEKADYIQIRPHS